MDNELSGRIAMFYGSNYSGGADRKRLMNQQERVIECMKDGLPRTLSEIAKMTGDPEASISAQLRGIRRNTDYDVAKAPRGRRDNGLWEYWFELGGLRFGDDGQGVMI